MFRSLCTRQYIAAFLLFAFLLLAASSVMAQETENNPRLPLLSASVHGSGFYTLGEPEKRAPFSRYSTAWKHALLPQPSEGHDGLRLAETQTSYDWPSLSKTRINYAATGNQQLAHQTLKRQLNFQLQDEEDRWARTRRTLERSTLAGLWATGALGTILAFNRPTLLSDGRCETGNPIFGDYGCGELSTVHGMSAVAAITLYTASEVFNLTTGPEQHRSPTYRLFTWIHRAGLMALPLVGIISRYPEVIGINDSGTQDDFSRAMRSIHLGAGYITVLAYTVTFSLD